MLKELTVKEALQLLADKYPEPVTGIFWNWNDCEENRTKILRLVSIEIGKHAYFKNEISDYYSCFGIEVPDEERYMTKQELSDWIVTVGYKNHQMKCKDSKNWYALYDLYNLWEDITKYEYRTVELVNGKIVYGKPKEFLIRKD